MSDIQKQIAETLAKVTPGRLEYETNNDGKKIWAYAIYRNYTQKVATIEANKLNFADSDVMVNAIPWLTHQQQLIESQAKEIEKLKNALSKAHILLEQYELII